MTEQEYKDEENAQALQPITDPDPMDEEIIVTPEEIIDAFEAVYEELVMLRNSVINLHERLEKIEGTNGTV